MSVIEIVGGAILLVVSAVIILLTLMQHTHEMCIRDRDTPHARIYDRLLEMCVPISCIGASFRRETAQEKLERLKALIG